MVAAAAIGVALFFTSGLLGLATSNSVSAKRIAVVTHANLVLDSTPAGCTGMTFTNIVYCKSSSPCFGTPQSDLIFGDSGNNTIFGGNGNDCIISGGGDDIVNGQNGSNVCIEGTGNNTYRKCTVVNP
jgi:hypothetical protein